MQPLKLSINLFSLEKSSEGKTFSKKPQKYLYAPSVHLIFQEDMVV